MIPSVEWWRGANAGTLSEITGWSVYPRSLAEGDGLLFFLARRCDEKRLGILGPYPAVAGWGVGAERITVSGHSVGLNLVETSHVHAVSLRRVLRWLAPVRIGVRKAAGLGDRLGIGTPGHVRAVRHVEGIMPVFAQQSIREMERTQRTPENVLDAAMWGIFQEGWRLGYGADADHLKTEADIDACVGAGYVMYTLDPREHVDNAAHTDTQAVLRAKWDALPWPALETMPRDMLRAYAGQVCEEGLGLTIAESDVVRAACKYGRALAHLAALYRYLASRLRGRDWELEVSVDETDTPTSPAEHWIIARELRRLGVRWVSLAPRFVGRFEKGVDYIGDLDQLERELAQHVAIARALGPYKLSLHSGSDKFSVYPVAARQAGDLVHLKTAGTSYLEALRAVASIEPGLFRAILAFARAHYEADRASYHVSGEVKRMLHPMDLSDAELPSALDQFDTRQALHVTFGSVLTACDDGGRYLFRDDLYAALARDEEAHYGALESYLCRHLRPFSD